MNVVVDEVWGEGSRAVAQTRPALRGMCTLSGNGPPRMIFSSAWSGHMRAGHKGEEGRRAPGRVCLRGCSPCLGQDKCDETLVIRPDLV